MKKIKTVFKRDSNYNVIDEVRPENQWVLDGEGVATIKWDGTSCLLENGVLFRRKTLKPDQYLRDSGGSIMKAPADWRPAQPEPRPNGKWPGWMCCDIGEPADQYHFEALDKLIENHPLRQTDDGTYELVGPKIQGNPYSLTGHILVPHKTPIAAVHVWRDYESVREFLRYLPQEGLVFHHPDGRMAKIRRSDYGFDWPMS